MIPSFASVVSSSSLGFFSGVGSAWVAVFVFLVSECCFGPLFGHSCLCLNSSVASHARIALLLSSATCAVTPAPWAKKEKGRRGRRRRRRRRRGRGRRRRRKRKEKEKEKKKKKEEEGRGRRKRKKEGRGRRRRNNLDRTSEELKTQRLF